MWSPQQQSRGTSILVAMATVMTCTWPVGHIVAQTTFNPVWSPNTTLDSGLQEGDRALLLDLHNEFRRETVQAADMNRLEWSSHLEQQASRWVARCEFLHQVDPVWGENLYRSTFGSSAQNLVNDALMAWQLEQYNTKMAGGEVDCCDGKKMTCCHYTQIVWASTKYLGCAIKVCPTLKGEIPGDDYQDAWYLACYYYPRGNVVKQQPFQLGDTQCSACATTSPDCDRGLCYFDKKRC